MSNYTKNKLGDNKNTSWGVIFDMIEENQEILDIGCSSGNFGAELIKRKHCVVDGVDIDEKDVELAKKQLSNAFIFNVEKDPIKKIAKKYDVILMIDVIEHLVNPRNSLNSIGSLLKPGGVLIFSVPNMAHISIRLNLLNGKLNYTKTGLLDDTHLHFYTEEYLSNVLNSAGFTISDFRNTSITYPKQLIKKLLKDAGLSYTDEFNKHSSSTNGDVYQLIGAATFSDNKKIKTRLPKRNPHDEHFLEIEKVIKNQKEHIACLEKSVELKDNHISNIEKQFQSYRSKIENNITVKVYRFIKGIINR